MLFDESLSNEERLDAIISSAAVPFAFPPETIDERMLVDGSLFSTISIGDPISRCREEVDSDKDIIVDTIMCYTSQFNIKDWHIHDTRWMNAYDYYSRRKEIFHYYYYKEDLIRMTRGYPDVDFRLIVQPSDELTQDGMVPIYATAADIQKEMDLGYHDGLKAVADLLAGQKPDGFIDNRQPEEQEE